MKSILSWLDELPLAVVLIPAVFLALAPFAPEPHLVEKIRMLLAGDLQRPIDIFDLIMHGAPLLVLGLKLVRQWLGLAAAQR